MPTAQSSFKIESWDQEDVDTGIGKAHVTKTFAGDIEGTSVANLLLGGVDGGGMAYMGFERFDVSIAGRLGGFILLHYATSFGTEGETKWTILAGSGTGELDGIAGSGEIVRHDDGSHDFSLNYTLP